VAEQSRSMTPETPTLLLVNPAARRGGRPFPDLRARLAARLNLVDAAMPDTAERLLDRIDDALGRGVRRVVVAGGDGTLSLVAGRLHGTGVALGVLPWGTGNTFAHGIGLPRRWSDLLEVLCAGGVRTVDVGMAEAATGRRAFLNSLTLGVSQRLAGLLTPHIKRRLGWLAWPLAIERALRATPQVAVHLTYDDGQEDAFSTWQLIVANGRALAGPLPATPSASGEDGRLEVFSLGGGSTLGLLRLAALTVLGRHIADPEAHYRACGGVRIACAPCVDLDVDGDVWGRTPVTCTVRPGALHVLVPANAKRTGEGSPVRQRGSQRLP
jgi:diacylglycerol kinase (ATP)